jgi:hypothetical protein
MARTHWGRFGAVLATGLLVAACDKADDALGLVPDTGIIDQIKNGGVAKGVVKDIYGNPVEGAEILVYTYSQNLDHFYRPEEVPNPDDFKDPTTYKVKLDIGQLVNDGNPETVKGTTDADGKFEFDKVPLDGIILVARKNGYAVDIAGVDTEDGTISIDSVLKPTEVNTEAFTFEQNFMLAGGPPPFADEPNVVPPDVTPVPPPPAPEPPPPPEPIPPPPAPECVVSADCGAPGEICRDGECMPECTEATAEVDCGPGKACREGACGPECYGHSDCAEGEICDAASLTCAPAECTQDSDCGLGQCNGEETQHGYCAPTCTDGGGECDATNQICDLNLGGCRFECLANSDCGGDTPLCADNHCAPAECDSDEACLAEGENGGYCVDFACQRECEDDAACSDRNMVCDVTAFRCKIECVADGECEGNANGPICENNRCAAAECDGDDACLAEDKNGGFCVANRCVPQCAPDGDLAGACGDANAECPRARCILPDPNELHPPTEAATWKSFLVNGLDDALIVDATAGSGIIGADAPLAENGGVVRLVGEVNEPTAGDVIAFLRVQVGDSHCSPVAYAPISVTFPIWLKDGKINSEKGAFQEWFVLGAYQQMQLDLDTEIGNGNESNLVTVADRCAPDNTNDTPTSALSITLGWDKDKVDADLHIWNQDNEETFYGSRLNGERRRSSYGRIDVDDRNGYGPEVFSLNPEVTSGVYVVRARYFAGPVATPTTDFQVRVIRKLDDGSFADETFTATANRRAGAESGWVDIGVFSIGAGAQAIADETP